MSGFAAQEFKQNAGLIESWEAICSYLLALLAFVLTIVWIQFAAHYKPVSVLLFSLSFYFLYNINTLFADI